MKLRDILSKSKRDGYNHCVNISTHGHWKLKTHKSHKLKFNQLIKCHNLETVNGKNLAARIRE